MAIVEATEGSLHVTWACAGLPALRATVLEAALTRRHRVHGLLDGCFEGPAPSQAFVGSVDARLQTGVQIALKV